MRIYANIPVNKKHGRKKSTIRAAVFMLLVVGLIAGIRYFGGDFGGGMEEVAAMALEAAGYSSAC